MTAERATAPWLRALLVLLALTAIGGFVALGVWQAGRATEKQAMLDAFAAALIAPDAIALDAALATAAEPPQRVRATLELPAELPWLLLDNQRRGAQVGLLAYRIARVAGATNREDARLPWVLVEFGWIALPPTRELPPLPDPPRSLQVEGLLLAPPSVGLRFVRHVIDDGAEALLLTYLDPAEIGADLGIELHGDVVRPDPALPIGFARDLEALPNTLPPEKHRGYALQWFGLAAAVAVITLVLLFRRRH